MSDTQREFLNVVLAHSGMPCLAWLKPGVKGMRHKVVGTIERAVAFVEDFDGTREDLYFCISTLQNETIVDRGTKRVRTQANTSHTRVFVLDMDVHPAGHEKYDPAQYYVSQDDAREGVKRIVEALGLPDPIVVNSGYGLHVYWPMLEGVPSTQWKPIAERFKRALQMIEPLAIGDGTRVADLAGVLRVPDTCNLKNGAQAEVYIEQWHSDWLDFGDFARQMEVHGGPAPKSQTAQRAAPIVDLTIPREELEPVELTALIKNCNWVKQYIRHQATADEPSWYAMLGLAPYVVHSKDGNRINGATIAHVFSNKHPQYSEADTDKKYIQAQAAQTGPTTCARFYGIKKAGCEGCPFIGHVKSPCSAARLSKPITEPKEIQTAIHTTEGVLEETVMIPVPPKPYYRGEDGGIFFRTKDENGEDFIAKIYEYDFYPTRRFRTENVETESMECHLHLPHDGMRTFKLPTELLADMKKLSQFLASRGVVTEMGKGKLITRYLTDYVRDMQMNNAAEIEFSRFGWRDVGTSKPKFVVGNGYISKDAPLTKASFAYFLKDAAKAVAKLGSFESWRQAFNVYQNVPDSECYQIAALLGFAAPLFSLTDYSGVMYNMVGPSGAGKSTALRLMTSVWGKPTENHVRAIDNEVPIYNFIGYLNSVPVAFDELTKMDPEKLGKFVLNFTGGRGKMRAMRNGMNADQMTEWDTIVAATSNTSVYSKLADARTGYTAEAMRVFEVNVPVADPQYKLIMTQAEARIHDNYGHAGRMYIEWLLPRLDAIKQLIAKKIAKLDEEYQLPVDQRFWTAFIACLEVGGVIAAKLGLHDYDAARLAHWAMGGTREARHEIDNTHSSPINVLAEYFNNTLDGTLQFRQGAVNLDTDAPSIRSIKNRIEYDGMMPRKAYISVASIREYCRVRSIDVAWLKRGLQKDDVLLADNCSKRLAAGTNLPTTPTRCWEINMNHTMLLEGAE
jgi:energy-coupling factor transporter ATP-binding protein EcfA2